MKCLISSGTVSQEQPGTSNGDRFTDDGFRAGNALHFFSVSQKSFKPIMVR